MSWQAPDVDAPAVTTEEARITDLFDPAKTGSWRYEMWFNGAGDFTTSTSGSGATGISNRRVVAATGTTQDSAAQILDQVAQYRRAPFSWDSNLTFRYQVHVNDTGELFEFGPSTRSLASITDTPGFIFESGDIKVKTTSSASKTTIVSGYSTGYHDLLLDWTSGQKARFVVNGNEKVITSDLPSGPITSNRIWSAVAKNPNSATDARAEIHHAEVVQYP